jgi:heavy metal sensor kinase
MSIRLRLTLWYTGLLSIVLAVFALLVYTAVARQLANQLEYVIHLRALGASRAAHALPMASAFSHIGEPWPLRSIVDVGAEDLYTQVVTPGGDVLSASENLSRPLPTSSMSLQAAMAGRDAHDTLALPDQRVALYSVPFLQDSKAPAVLQVVAPLQPMEGSLAELRLVLGLIVVGASALAGLIGAFLATQAMRPVDRMTRSAHAIGSGADFSRRLPQPARQDELGRLATTFNEMLARLEQALLTQRRFLADAAHELRTPLAGIRTNVETLLRQPGSELNDCRDTVAAVLRETDRMARLVADLLVLARADAAQPLVCRPLALDPILLEVYQQEQALANGVQLTLGEFEQAEIQGDPDRIKQMLLNLTDNALRYTQAGGAVTLDLYHRNGSVILRVSDTGPGIPPEHQTRVFDRFYRIDQPRSRSAGGTGLGLAICKWIAEAHGGRIELESHVGSGSVFSVILPVHGAAAAAAASSRAQAAS